jgi:ABC-type multidrug transport system fused ATPase/permease subunit
LFVFADRQKSLGQLVSYAPQDCWLESETIEDNILFGKRFEKELYRQVVLASGLNENFESLTDKMKVIQNVSHISDVVFEHSGKFKDLHCCLWYDIRLGL